MAFHMPKNSNQAESELAKIFEEGHTQMASQL